MPSPLSLIQKALKKLSPDDLEVPMARAQLLGEQVDLSRFSPSAIARAVAMRPAAQRGFSESLVSTKAPIATTLIDPATWGRHTPQLDELHDRRIVDALKQSIQKDKLRDLPLLWLDQYPTHMDAGYEGRHRMKALSELYGNDPVPVNVVPGARYNIVQTPYYPEPSREYVEELTISPLELLKRQIMMGDKPIEINPLWVGQ